MNDSAFIIKVINAVKARECLWNVHSPDYSKRIHLEKAWQDVSEEVGQSETYCRDKWRNVRTGFLRSLQRNTRDHALPDDSLNDSLKARRNRFYLHDEMKFLLSSAEALEQAKKRRISSRQRSLQQMPSSFADDEYSENTSTLSTWKLDTSMDQYENSDEGEAQQIEVKKSKNCDDAETKPQRPHSSRLETINNPPLPEEANQCFALPEHNCMEQISNRSEQQLLDFFRGNIDDVLSLSKRNQRLFKRRMVQLIEELHESEESQT